jgi:hypothetical protein
MKHRMIFVDSDSGAHTQNVQRIQTNIPDHEIRN